MFKTMIIGLFLILIAVSPTWGGDIAISHSPKWSFHANYDYPTGIGWADMDGNGWALLCGLFQ